MKRDIDEKFSAIGTILDGKIREITEKQVRIPDLSSVLRDDLGESCWDWVGEDVRRMFTSAEGVYRYLVRQPAEDNPDFSPALLEYCRGLELLLNVKLGKRCEEIRDTVRASQVLQGSVHSRFPSIDLERVLRGERTLSMVQMADLLHIARDIRGFFSETFSRELEDFLGKQPLLLSPIFFETLAQVGAFFRNGIVSRQKRWRLLQKRNQRWSNRSKHEKSLPLH